MTRRLVAALAIALAQSREPQNVATKSEVAGAIVDASGRPVPRATVRLGEVTELRAYVDVADEAGRFRFGNVEPGRYTVSAYASSYPVVQYGASSSGQRGVPVTVTAGQRLDDLLVTLRKGGAITGTVRDEFGDPAGVAVFARDVLGRGVMGATDQHGRFRLANLQPGSYTVGVRPGGTPVTSRDANGQPGRVVLGPAWYGGATASAALPVRIDSEAEVSGIDLAVRYVPAAPVTVTFSAPGEISAAPTLEIRADGDVAGGALSSRFWENGAFRFDGLPAGRYVFVGSAMLRRENGNVERLRARVDTTIDGVAPATIHLRLETAAQLVGRFVFDGEGKPPRGLVSLRPISSGANEGFITEPALMRPDGLFSLAGIAPGEYVIEVPPYMATETGWVLTSMMVEGKEMVDTPVVLATGTITAVTLTMSKRPAELSGRVIDAGGRARSDLTLVLFSTDPRHWYMNSRRLQRVLPDARGDYRLASLPPGEYWLAALSGGLEFPNGLVAGLTDLAAGAIRIALSPGETKRQDLRTGKRPLP